MQNAFPLSNANHQLSVTFKCEVTVYFHHKFCIYMFAHLATYMGDEVCVSTHFQIVSVLSFTFVQTTNQSSMIE